VKAALRHGSGNGPKEPFRLSMRTMSSDDACRLSAMLKAQRPEYMRNFIPFSFDTKTILGLLSCATKDQYWLIDVNDEVAGFVMLRGLDAGFDRPAFGIVIGERFAGQGIATSAVDFSLNWCRDNGVREVMLKVAETNAAALRIYHRAGFVAEGRCPDTGHIIHSLALWCD
jgi:RimJ/RimL family protein N-acetyltransferase